MQTEPHRFCAALSTAFPETRRATVRHILNLGAGRCDECAWLIERFPQSGITVLEQDVEAASRLKQSYSGLSDRIRIVCDDALRFLSYESVVYDLIVIRHPDIDKRRPVWRRILRGISGRLASNGLLVVTTYTGIEMIFVEMAVKRLVAYRPLEAADLPEAQISGSDRYILTCGFSASASE